MSNPATSLRYEEFLNSDSPRSSNKNGDSDLINFRAADLLTEQKLCHLKELIAASTSAATFSNKPAPSSSTRSKQCHSHSIDVSGNVNLYKNQNSSSDYTMCARKSTESSNNYEDVENSSFSDIMKEFDPLQVSTTTEETDEESFDTSKPQQDSFTTGRRRSDSESSKSSSFRSNARSQRVVRSLYAPAAEDLKPSAVSALLALSVVVKKCNLELQYSALVHRLSRTIETLSSNTLHKLLISPRVAYPMPNGLTSLKLVVKIGSPNTSNLPAEFLEAIEKMGDHSGVSKDQNIMVFTCDVDSAVEQIMGHILYTSDCFKDVTPKLEEYALKVYSLEEFLLPQTQLSDYAYVHHCAKLNKDVELELVKISQKENIQCTVGNETEESVCDSSVKYHDISIALETFDKELFKWQESILKNDLPKMQAIVQSVKMICIMLHNIWPLDIVQNLDKLTHFNDRICEQRKTSRSVKLISGRQDSFTIDKEAVKEANRLVLSIRQSIIDFLKIYSNSSRVQFTVDSTEKENDPAKVTKEISSAEETLIIRIESVHNLPQEWFEIYERFYLMSYLTHGLDEISSVSKTDQAKVVRGYSDLLKFDSWITFDRNQLCTLPRETRICLILYGTKIEMQNAADSDAAGTTNGHDVNSSESQVKCFSEVQVCWLSCPLFDHDRYLHQGTFFLTLNPSPTVELWGAGPYLSDFNKKSPCLVIQFPAFDVNFRFPEITLDRTRLIESQIYCKDRTFNSLAADQQQILEDIVQHGSTLDIDDKELLWEKRHYLTARASALHLVLKSALSWNWAFLTNVYTLLQLWSPLSVGQAAELLLPEFPDVQVRRAALDWMHKNGSDELCELLPQLTEALKFETNEDSPLAELLLEFSVQNCRFAFLLYWQLEQRISGQDSWFATRCQLLQMTLKNLMGYEFSQNVQSQRRLIHNMNQIAQGVKDCRENERKMFLSNKVNQLDGLLLSQHVKLPLCPSVVVTGVNTQKCQVYNSLSLPLKVSFRTCHNASFDLMFKIGDDLRQDALVLQLVHLMDNIWLKEGLDLRMLFYKCLSTDYRKGIIELVPDCKTLREIHVQEGGVTGALKDNLIGKWLQKQNPSELDYLGALDNFRRSCAGWCVGTFILGIGDRHNDNIMMTSRGHTFHIDFSKYLGETENFGSFKRDRTPFILTSDMVDVINCGDTKATPYFQDFVDYCCRAFNIVRNNYALFINLMKLMLKANIPGLNEDSVQYVCSNLWLDHSDSEASVRFTRMIEESMNNRFPKWNFLVHTIAQHRKAKHANSDALRLSFVPKIYNSETDGKIISIRLVGCEKWRVPEKIYMYKIRIDRKNVRVPSFIYRSYKEINEFAECLCLRFPLLKLPILPKDRGIGRTNVRQIAERRKIYVRQFFDSLSRTCDETLHCDLTYTFFHSILRDERNFGTSVTANNDGQVVKMGSSFDIVPISSSQNIRGELKMCIEYKKGCLEIFVQHARNLSLINSTTLPDSYVKSYLRPDEDRKSKRKTRIAKKALNPTYNERLIYKCAPEALRDKTLEVSVWHSDVLKENCFIGGVQVAMADLLRLPDRSLSQWFRLGNVLSAAAPKRT